MLILKRKWHYVCVPIYMFYVKYNVVGNTDLPNVPRGTILFLVRG